MGILSLRKAIDDSSDVNVTTVVESYCHLVGSLRDAGAQACPPVADRLRSRLGEIQDRLRRRVEADTVNAVSAELDDTLADWGKQAGSFYNDRSTELKEFVSIVEKATGELAARDETFGHQFHGVIERLRATSQMDDLKMIKQSLSESVTEIIACAGQLNQQGQKSLNSMRAQLEVYQCRLAESERVMFIDSLTGLTNRRGLETHLQRRITERKPFSVIFWDLNGFKSVNDTFGHAAGDELLQQVATELRAAARTADAVGRWGGDEFVAISDGAQVAAEKYAARVEQWITGKYPLKSAGGQRVSITAATGIGSWQSGDELADILNRADVSMYASKAKMKAV